MPHVEQAQCGCNRCGKVTLHSRVVEPFNHVLHLLLTVLCCCWWAPFWLILALSHDPRRDPWRCSTCGQIAGTITPEQANAMVIQRANQEAEQAYWESQRKAAKAEQRAATVAAIGKQLKALPGQVDYALRKIAGEGNDILYRFLQIATIAVAVGIVIAVVYTAFSMIASIF